MPLIFEDSVKVTKKQIPIPQNAKRVFKAMKKIYEPFLDKNIPGSKILKSLGSDKKYNKKGANSKTNGEEIKQDSVNVNDAKVRLHRMNKLPKNSIQYQLNGGELAANIYRDGIARARGTKEVEAVKPPKPTSNAELKPSSIEQEKITTPNGKITYNITSENKIIKESNNEWNVFYDYLSEYDPYYVLSEFFSNPSGKQDWGTLINPNMYKKALTEFTKYGRLMQFPSKYIYQWMGIIMKNTAILVANTDLAGHSQIFPTDDVVDCAETMGVDLEPSYYACSKWLEKKGLYDWMKMPDGSDAWSDFGIEPLCKIFSEYDEDLPPEKVLVIVNKALDVYHQRGDMASIFVQGGSDALSKIAEQTQKPMKKIYITEKQIKTIAEGKKNEWTFDHFRKQNDVNNNLKLLLEYPHYFVHFLTKWNLVENWEEEPFSTLYDLCEWVFGAIEEGDEKHFIDNGKKEIYDLIMNNEFLSSLTYRYIENYIKPLKHKQDIIDKYNRKEPLKNIDWSSPKNYFQILGDDDKPKTYLKY